jgi:hypothetical protein
MQDVSGNASVTSKNSKIWCKKCIFKGKSEKDNISEGVLRYRYCSIESPSGVQFVARESVKDD